MDVHAGASDLLGAWALDACEASEAAAVEAHLGDCARCAAEAGQLRSVVGALGVDQVRLAPAALRSTTLAAARTRRPPLLLRTLVEAYAGQVARLGTLLDDFGTGDWDRPDPRHENARGVLAHLARNDAMLAEDLDLPVLAIPAGPGPAVRAAWRAQSRILVRGLDDVALDREVRLAGRGAHRTRPVRDVLVQRAFETWTHRDDMAGGPLAAPPPAEVGRIVELAVRLLPAALHAYGLSRPDEAARLVLGEAQEWMVPIGHLGSAWDAVAVTIRTEAVEFARLVANRRTSDTVRHTMTGDRRLGTEVLRIASTLGCD
jgi:hypothetical protein